MKSFNIKLTFDTNEFLPTLLTKEYVLAVASRKLGHSGVEIEVSES